MRTSSISSVLVGLLLSCLGLLPAFAVQNRISRVSAEDNTRAPLANGVSPRARAATDLGTAPLDTILRAVTLRFNMTDAQNAALDQLSADQQTPGSPRYHQWLTPEQYAAQFGLSTADIASVTAWLQSQNLQVTSVARSRSFLTVSGTVAQVQHAFGTTLHTVSIAGEQHIANLTDPTLPVPISKVVNGITGLNDFRLKPHVRVRTIPAPNPKFTSSISGNHYIAPGDFYAIYGVKPLLDSSINGSGVTVAVMGQTDISVADVAAFRAASGLAVNVPTVRLFGADPGIITGDVDEAQLDIEWSGAVAPAASILYVNSNDVIAGSLTQAIDNNLAPIITISYGACETAFGSSDIAVFNQLFRQANAQGQTIVGPTGDTGATDCDYQATTATNGLTVDFPASSPYVTALGGTMFNENGGTYFKTTNDSNSGSATGYIPEAVWNESVTGGGLSSAGGGLSSFFTKPSYQTGLGVPNDFSRDVPDISFNAAAAHDPYVFCSRNSCTNGYRNAADNLNVVGGTSVPTPAFAGVLALLEQKIHSSIGNANPTLYALANSTFSTSVFHDVTVGNNASPCTAGSTDCPNGGSIGYSATTGYDLASGWGTVDVFSMVNDWLLVKPVGSAVSAGTTFSTTALSTNSTSVTSGAPVSFSANVASAASTSLTTPTGFVQLLVDDVAVGTPVALANGAATLPLVTTILASGGHRITAAYSGDTTYNGSKGTSTIDIVSGTLPDFLLTASAAGTSTPSGGTAPGITFTVAPANGFTGQVNFAISTSSTTLVSTPTFSVNPVSITSTSSGTTVLTLVAAQTTIHAKPGPGSSASLDPYRPWTLAGSGVAFAGLMLLCVPRRRRRVAALLAVFFSIGILSLSGCSTGAGGTTVASTATVTKSAPGTYALTISATSKNAAGATVSHNSNVIFTVQ